MHRFVAMTAWLALALPPVAGQSPPRVPPRNRTPVDDPAIRAERAFALLSPAEQHELVEFFGAETSRLDTFQAALMRSITKAQDVDSALWPELADAPVFDPNEHAPAQPVRRRALAADDPRVAALRARAAGPGYDSAWVYDYVTRELRHTRSLKDPVRIFHNGLAGFPPDVDLCAALVERALDNGAEQRALAAFGHAYCDRAGAVYTGITLYDAWASGAEIEMPDVDTLGIVHGVLGDWKTWTAPVPASAQSALFARIGVIYEAAHHHRGLRHALARTYVVGSATQRDGYAAQLDGLHALWDAYTSDPAQLAPKLPAAAEWNKFLTNWAKRCRSEGKLAKSGANRRARLDRDCANVRTVLFSVLDEYGAFERLDGSTSAPKSTKTIPAR